MLASVHVWFLLQFTWIRINAFIVRILGSTGLCHSRDRMIVVEMTHIDVTVMSNTARGQQTYTFRANKHARNVFPAYRRCRWTSTIHHLNNILNLMSSRKVWPYNKIDDCIQCITPENINLIGVYIHVHSILIVLRCTLTSWS